MVWSDVSSEIAVDKVIRASTHQKIFDNFLAMAKGDPGAPKVQAPIAMATTELGTGKVLHPDGLGGLFWGNTNTASVSTGIGGGGTTRYMQTGPHDDGVYLILAFGRHRADRGNNDADRIHRTWQGFCLRSTNTLLAQFATYVDAFRDGDNGSEVNSNGSSTSAFSVQGSNTRFTMSMPSSFDDAVQASGGLIGLQIG